MSKDIKNNEDGFPHRNIDPNSLTGKLIRKYSGEENVQFTQEEQTSLNEISQRIYAKREREQLVNDMVDEFGDREFGDEDLSTWLVDNGISSELVADFRHEQLRRSMARHKRDIRSILNPETIELLNKINGFKEDIDS